MDYEFSVTDIKEFRDKVLSERSLNERDKENSLEAKKKLEAMLGSISEEDIKVMEDNGIYIRELIDYDKEKILTKEYNGEFHEIYKRVLGQIMEMIKRNKGDSQ